MFFATFLVEYHPLFVKKFSPKHLFDTNIQYVPKSILSEISISELLDQNLVLFNLIFIYSQNHGVNKNMSANLIISK